MKFNEKLQKLRKEKGLSQESLAEILNVSRQAISKWESGQSYPETENLIILSGIFGVTIDRLIKDGELETDEVDNKNEINTAALSLWWTKLHTYEYKSKRNLFGLPLVHINFGWGIKKAKGIIAIGNSATGFIALGIIAKGLLSLGVLSLGIIGIGCVALGLLLSVGSFSIGTFAIGAVAFGVFTLGSLSIGMFSVGSCSIASHIAIGAYARGHIAIGNVAKGVRTFIDASPKGENYSMIDIDAVKKVIYEEYPRIWHWVVNLITSVLE